MRCGSLGWKRRDTASIVWRALAASGSISVNQNGSVLLAMASTSDHASRSLARPRARRFGQIAERQARFRVRAPSHQPQQRPCQEAQHCCDNRPDPDAAGLPEPQHPEHQQRYPRKRDRHDKQRLRPVTSQRACRISCGLLRLCALEFFACCNPAFRPSAKARRTSAVGASRPRR